jgi:hypothetical protein
MSTARKTRVADRHMPHLTPCGRPAKESRVLLATVKSESTCTWCLAYVRGSWGWPPHWFFRTQISIVLPQGKR